MQTVKEYVAALPDERRKAIAKVRATIRKSLPKGYVEAFSGGMISYEVPLKRFADTYNGKPLMYAALASQKRYMAVYLHAAYVNPELNAWFVESYKATGKKLDMGKSCVRFKKLDDLPLDVIGEMISRTSVDDFVHMHRDAKK